MATDATGTPSANFSFPKFNTSVDAPSGLGSNAIVDDIDSKLGLVSTLLGAIARISVRKNSAGSVFSRRRLNLIEGTGITLTVADDAADEEVDVTIASSSTLPTQANVEVDTEESISLTNTWENLATATSVTVPATGTYLVLFEAEAINATANFDPNIGVVVGDNNPAASDIRDQFWPTANARIGLVAFTVMALTLNDVLKLRYRDRSRNDTTFRSRKLAIIRLV